MSDDVVPSTPTIPDFSIDLSVSKPMKAPSVVPAVEPKPAADHLHMEVNSTSHPSLAAEVSPILHVPEAELTPVAIDSLPNAENVESPKKSSMVLFTVVLIAAVIAGAGVVASIFMANRQEEILTTSIPTPTSIPLTVASIRLNTEYSNPFERSTQYVNPFVEEQNPFDQLQ